MTDNSEILSFLHDEEDMKLGERILDIAEEVQERNNVRSTSFLNPREQEITVEIISQLYGVNYISSGGHPAAERERITVFPDFLFPEHQEVPLICLKISGNFDFVSVSHSDFLGAVLGLGIKRELIGDIFIHENMAQVVVDPDIKDEICLNLDRVNEVPVEIEEMDCGDIIFEEKHRKEIRSTVASLRLDAILSAGFGDSRSRSKQAIEEGRIKLNWRKADNPAAEIEIGDLISYRGRGRLKVAERTGISNSGRIKLILERIT